MSTQLSFRGDKGAVTLKLPAWERASRGPSQKTARATWRRGQVPRQQTRALPRAPWSPLRVAEAWSTCCAASAPGPAPGALPMALQGPVARGLSLPWSCPGATAPVRAHPEPGQVEALELDLGGPEAIAASAPFILLRHLAPGGGS